MKTLVLHHSAGNQDRPARDDWETGNRWYNWIIDGAGRLHEFKTTANQRSCGKTFDLAFSGDFTRVDPRPAQIAAWNAFRDSHQFDVITNHGQLARDKPGCATASACPGRLLEFITLNPMPTCEQKLAAEIASHKETIKREQTNYQKWQDEIDKRHQAENDLAAEIEAHKDTIKELEATKEDRERLVAERNDKFSQIKAVIDA